jgi:hypothetical protein
MADNTTPDGMMQNVGMQNIGMQITGGSGTMSSLLYGDGSVVPNMEFPGGRFDAMVGGTGMGESVMSGTGANTSLMGHAGMGDIDTGIAGEGTLINLMAGGGLYHKNYDHGSLVDYRQNDFNFYLPGGPDGYSQQPSFVHLGDQGVSPFFEGHKTGNGSLTSKIYANTSKHTVPLPTPTPPQAPAPTQNPIPPVFQNDRSSFSVNMAHGTVGPQAHINAAAGAGESTQLGGQVIGRQGMTTRPTNTAGGAASGRRGGEQARPAGSGVRASGTQKKPAKRFEPGSDEDEDEADDCRRVKRARNAKILVELPDWVDTTKSYLLQDLNDPDWLDCVERWRKFEEGCATRGGMAGRLNTNGRPEALKQWLMGRQYKTLPQIPDKRTYAKEWLEWWHRI